MLKLSPLVLKLSGGGNIDNDNIHTRENNVIGEGVYRPPPHVLKLSGGGYIDNDDIRTWENNIIGEGVYRPPHVLKLSGGGFISTTTTYIHGKIMLSRRGYIDPPSC